MELLDIRIIDIIDIVLVAFLLYYIYKLIKGTVAINIFIGIVIIYAIWKVTELLEMEMLSKILGGFLGVGMVALVVVFQQEIRKFLLMIGTTNVASRTNFLKQLKFLKSEIALETDVDTLLNACKKMSKTNTGALIVLERTNSLDFLISTGDAMNAEMNQVLLESIFYKNSPLHDGATIIRDNFVVATRVVLPVSDSINIPSRFGLRHKAAFGISEKTDAVCLLVSEETGEISYIKDGSFELYADYNELLDKLRQDIQ